MRRTALLALLLTTACSDYNLNKPGDDEPGGDGTEDHDDGEVGEPEGDEDDGDPSEDDPGLDDPSDDTAEPDEPEEGPPDEPLDDCEGDVEATWESGEIAVLGREDAPDSGTLTVPEAGWYHVYDTSIAESEDAQGNESAYLRIPSSADGDGLPMWGNCSEDWVVVDPDNGGPLPDGTRLYMGTFYLNEGENTVWLHHYCTRYRAGECADLHIEDDSDSTCDTNNPNSVHFSGEGLCLQRVEIIGR